ncbi:MAG TPA: PDDEXK nuclease domain-containing protein [Puia sp.]|nr:PDDEXK nuclease domain-containing protein [Puia sp.]
MDFVELIYILSNINEKLREESLRAVNTSLTLRNWFFGFYIVEFEQRGSNRAEYGKSLLATIASEMKNRAIPNTDERELRRFRQFYITYPAIASLIMTNDRIRGLLSPELAVTDKILDKSLIRGTSSPELEVSDYHYLKGDNPPVGILLCSDKDQEHVEFATAGIDDKVFVSQYLVALPDKKELEQFIKKEFRDSQA